MIVLEAFNYTVIHIFFGASVLVYSYNFLDFYFFILVPLRITETTQQSALLFTVLFTFKILDYLRLTVVSMGWNLRRKMIP